MAIPKIKKGPKGISLLKEYLFNKIKVSPKSDPDQKAKKSAERIPGKPKKRPPPTINLASPNPIQRPFEAKLSNRRNSAGRNDNKKSVGVVCFKKIFPASARAMKRYEKVSGRI